MRRDRGEPERGAQVQLVAALVLVDVVVVGDADEQLAVAVPVLVPHELQGVADAIAAAVPLQLPVGGGGQPRRTAVEDLDLAAVLGRVRRGVDPGAVPQRRGDRDVGVAVAVDVAPAGDLLAELGAALAALVGPIGGGREAGGRAVVDLGLPLAPEGRSVRGHSDDHVAVAVAVDVPRRVQVVAEVVELGGALDRPGHAGGDRQGGGVLDEVRRGLGRRGAGQHRQQRYSDLRVHERGVSIPQNSLRISRVHPPP